MNNAFRLIVAIVVVLFATLFILNALESERPWINHDVGYHTYLGKEMARGAELYIDLQEDNPPGNPILLGAIAVVAETIRLPDFVATHLFVLAVGLLGLLVLRRSFDRPERSLTALLVSCAYLLAIVRPGYSNNLYAGATGLPFDFGQREHLFVLLFVPYLARRLAGRGGVRSGFWCWVAMLGYVSTFKPFWAPMVLFVELFVWVRDRKLEWGLLLSLMVGGATPLLLLALHSPASAHHFLFVNIPTYLRGGFDYYASSSSTFVTSPLHIQILAGFVALTLLTMLALLKGWLSRGAIFLLLGSVALSYFAVWHQQKFWSYHTLPIWGLTLFAIAYILGSSPFKEGARRRLISAGALVVTLLVCGATIISAATMLQRYPPLGSFLVPAAERYERPMYFSMSVMVQYPPLLLDQPMLGPWTVMLDLSEIAALPEGDERERRLASYFDGVRQEITEQQPDLLVFSPQSQALPEGVTLHELFMRYAAIPAGDFREVSAQRVGVTSPLARGWRFYTARGAR